MKLQYRQFASFYIHIFEFFSSCGFFPMQWSDAQNKFVVGSLKDIITNVILTVCIFIELIYSISRTIWYFFLKEGERELNDKVLIITWGIMAQGSVFGITTLWKSGGLIRATATSAVRNIIQLKAITGITEQNDPIRKRLSNRNYGKWYWIGLVVYVFGVIELFRLNPKHPIFFYSIFNLEKYPLVWVPFLIHNLLNTGFYLGMLAFYGHYLRLCSVSIVHGAELLSPETNKPRPPCKIRRAMSWYRNCTLMVTCLNESVEHSLLASTALHLTGLSLAVFTMIRLAKHLSLFTYCLYYIIFVQVILYTCAAYNTMGIIPLSTVDFLAKWKYFVRNKKEKQTLRSLRLQGMNFSDLFMYKNVQIMHIANIAVNIIIFLLTM